MPSNPENNAEAGFVALILRIQKLMLRGEVSWWWNRRMQNSSLLTSTSRIHLQMGQFSQSTCWTFVEDFRQLKGQEKFPCNQVGWKKNKGRKEESKKGPETLVGSWRCREVSVLRKPPFYSGEISWDRNESLGDQRRM